MERVERPGVGTLRPVDVSDGIEAPSDADGVSGLLVDCEGTASELQCPGIVSAIEMHQRDSVGDDAGAPPVPERLEDRERALVVRRGLLEIPERFVDVSQVVQDAGDAASIAGRLEELFDPSGRLDGLGVLGPVEVDVADSVPGFGEPIEVAALFVETGAFFGRRQCSIQLGDSEETVRPAVQRAPDLCPGARSPGDGFGELVRTKGACVLAREAFPVTEIEKGPRQIGRGADPGEKCAFFRLGCGHEPLGQSLGTRRLGLAGGRGPEERQERDHPVSRGGNHVSRPGRSVLSHLPVSTARKLVSSLLASLSPEASQNSSARPLHAAVKKVDSECLRAKCSVTMALRGSTPSGLSECRTALPSSGFPFFSCFQ